MGQLRFIGSSQAAGLKLDEIRSILAIRLVGDAPCEHATALLRSKRGEVDERLRELQQLGEDLDALLVRSESLDPADCSPDAVCHVIAVDPVAPRV